MGGPYQPKSSGGSRLRLRTGLVDVEGVDDRQPRVLHHVVGEDAGDVHAGHAGQPGGQLSNQVVEAVGFAAAERGDQLGVGMIRGERRGICNNHLGRLSSW